jgi:hypothetical protein
MRKLTKAEKAKIKEVAETIGGAVLFAGTFYVWLLLAYICE